MRYGTAPMSATTAPKASLILVRGFLRDIDTAPRPTGLSHVARLAIAFDTCSQESVDAAIDPNVYMLLIECVCQVVAADRLWVEQPTPKAYSWADFRNSIAESLERLEPPSRIVCMNAAQERQAVIDCVPWWRVGGPEPYHDSCTLAVYADATTLVRLEKVVRDRSASVGVEVAPTIVGAAEAISKSGLRAVIRRLLGIRKHG
jgi:hypothetical protein